MEHTIEHHPQGQPQDRLRILWRLATDRTLDDAQKISAMLEAGARALNMDVALVGEIGKRYVLRYTFSVDRSFRPDQSMELDSPLCLFLAQSEASLFVPDLTRHELFTEISPLIQLGMRGYAGAPVWVGDRLYGSLSFMRHAPLAAFSEDDKTFVELLAAWFGQILLQKKQREELEVLVMTDALTGLPNRRAAEQRLAEEFARARRSGESFAIAVCDLDRFKLVNDHYGHAIGDMVLQAAAGTLLRQLRDGDWLARWGGEEFIVYLHHVDGPQAFAVTDRLRQAFALCPVETPHGRLELTLSAGISVFRKDDEGENLTRILSEADSALYEAKNSGRDRVVLHHTARRGVLWQAGEIQSALQDKRIIPAYQPIVDLASGQAVADEALARLLGTNGQITPAGEFIESAEGLNLIQQVDETITRQAMLRCTQRMGVGAATDFVHFINLSPQFLARPALVKKLLDEAQQFCRACNVQFSDVRPIVFEITERQHISDFDLLVREVQPLLDFGFRLALDDFGSGYSSFLYLAKLPISFLKIEGWMVANMRQNPRIRDMIQSIVDLSIRQGITTIAECIEDAETAELLREMGVNWGQGYHFGRPEFDPA